MPWTENAKLLALNLLTGAAPAAPPQSLWLALFKVSAQPGAGTEVNDATYHRQSLSVWTTNGTRLTNTNALNFSMSSDGEFTGIAVFDSPQAGSCLFWNDYDTTYAYSAGSDVPVPSQGLALGLIDPS